jgi:hypothetical protein
MQERDEGTMEEGDGERHFHHRDTEDTTNGRRLRRERPQPTVGALGESNIFCLLSFKGKGVNQEDIILAEFMFCVKCLGEPICGSFGAG